MKPGGSSSDRPGGSSVNSFDTGSDCETGGGGESAPSESKSELILFSIVLGFSGFGEMCVLSIEVLFFSAGITGGCRGDFEGSFGGMAGVAGVGGHDESSDSGFSGN